MTDFGAGLNALTPRPLLAIAGLIMATAGALPFVFRPVRVLTSQAAETGTAEPVADPAL